MEFIKDDSSLPVPLNIIPTLKSFKFLFNKVTKLFDCCRKKNFKMKKNDQKNTNLNGLQLKKTTVNKNGQMNIASIENVGNTKLKNSHVRKQSVSNELTYAVFSNLFNFLII